MIEKKFDISVIANPAIRGRQVRQNNPPIVRRSTSMARLFCILLIAFILILSDPSPGESQSAGTSSIPRSLVVAVVQDPPYSYKAGDGTWTGFNVELWSHIAREQRLDYTYREMPFGEMIQALKDGTIDLSIAAIFLTPKREREFDFSVPIATTRLAVATLPSAIEHPWWAAMRIFLSWGTLKVIASLIALLLLFGTLFWLIERRANPEHFGGNVLKGISSGVYWVGSTLASGVCFGVYIRSTLGRIIGLLWMFVCAVVLGAFVASLASSLTLDKLTSTAIDLKEISRMKLGTVSGGYTESLLKGRAERYALFQEEEDVLRAITNKQIEGFLYDEITLRYYQEREYRDRISIYPIHEKRLQFAFGMPAGSPLRKNVNVSILTLMGEPAWESLMTRYGFGEGPDRETRSPRRRNR
jgi:polar amino acid transport system substrate-binding protein